MNNDNISFDASFFDFEDDFFGSDDFHHPKSFRLHAINLRENQENYTLSEEVKVIRMYQKPRKAA